MHKKLSLNGALCAKPSKVGAELGAITLYGVWDPDGWRYSTSVLDQTPSLLPDATLLYGDGAITPAISVLSAIEGLKVYAPQTEHVIVPLTVAILVLLFVVQRKGTSFIGGIFGPVSPADRTSGRNRGRLGFWKSLLATASVKLLLRPRIRKTPLRRPAVRSGLHRHGGRIRTECRTLRRPRSRCSRQEFFSALSLCGGRCP